MSLVGNLEDLGLGDILQIVSLSRKSGILSLHSRNREGKIVFLNGQVIRASSSVFRENLGDLLLRHQIVDLSLLKEALVLQRDSQPPVRLGAILSERFGVSKDRIEGVVREQIEKIVYSFFGWNEGTFSFELGEPGDLAATNFNPLQFMLDQGLNPQWLAMEGSRIFDEKTHRGESFEDDVPVPLFDVKSILPEPVVEEVDKPAESSDKKPGVQVKAPIFLIDDEAEVGEGLTWFLQKRGYAVKFFRTSDKFIAAVRRGLEVGIRPILMIDTIMPNHAGNGDLGGCELATALVKEYPDLKILLFSDQSRSEADRIIKGLGLPEIIPKPSRESLRSRAGIPLLEAMAEDIGVLVGRPKPPVSGVAKHGELHDIGAELWAELGVESEASVPQKGPESPGLYLLKGMLQELSNSAGGGSITLMILRFASELMNRAVLFRVKENEIVGLGQFGLNVEGGVSADVLVRRMKVPRHCGSVFDQVIDNLSPLKTQLGESTGDRYLQESLGGERPRQIFLGPVVRAGRVVAVLYGDNLPELTPIGETESLEIFLAQAGLAMEKIVLEERLNGHAHG